MTNKQKIKFGIFATVVLFFAATFAKNWGSAVANVGVDDYAPKIKELKKQPALAKKQCPVFVKKLNAGIADLEQNGFKEKVLLTHKLIADCSYFAEDYATAAKEYKFLVKAEPQSPIWHFRIAQSLYKSGKTAEALPVIHLASQLADKAEIWLLKGEIQTALNLPNNAIESYQHAIKTGSFDQIQKAQTAIQTLSTR